MGCGASAKNAATATALNTAGFAATTGGATVAATGHAIAFGALSVADAMTFGLCDSIGDLKDDQFEEMQESGDNMSAGWKAFTSSSEFFNSEPSNNRSEWMKDIPDSTKITEMFIPGTHETMALCGGDLAECNGWTLTQQLDSGIRAFDVRAKHDCDALPIFHGIISQCADFKKDVVECIEDWLEKHPSEALFMRLRREGQCGEHKCEYHDEVVRELRKSDVWNMKLSKFATLGELRGRVHFIAFQSHLKLYVQPLEVQDEWNTGDEDKKFKAIMEHATQERTPGTLYLSFFSACGKDGKVCYKAPGAMAWQVNKLIHDEIPKFKPGVYMMDFPGTGLVEKLLAKNTDTA
mmetsp:Transcript_44524/g.123274  ORF Transcript_44524/g.123274 Transcript_44524/m.123274 type:complete len:350 (-) Transcript_44524:151-1200(-)